MTDSSSSSSRQQQQDTGQQQLRSDYGITQELLTGYCSAAAVARLAGGATRNSYSKLCSLGRTAVRL
jgi:hypothetical protein